MNNKSKTWEEMTNKQIINKVKNMHYKVNGINIFHLLETLEFSIVEA